MIGPLNKRRGYSSVHVTIGHVHCTRTQINEASVIYTPCSVASSSPQKHKECVCVCYPSAVETASIAMALLCVPLNKGTLGSLGLPMVSQYGWVSGVGKARVQPCHGRRTLSPILCSVQGNGNVAVKPPATLPAHVTLGRSSFPPDFAFGAASAAYQVSLSLI